MRLPLILGALATSIGTLHAQTRFEPAMMYHVTFAGILAYGEKLDLGENSDSGRVPFAGRLYTATHPGSCVDTQTPCRVLYVVVIYDPEGADGPLVWSLGVAGQLSWAEWLPPSPDMNQGLARLRLRVAPLDHRPGDGASLEQVEFEVGFSSTRVREPHL